MRGFTEETTPHQIGFEAFGVQARLCASSPELLAEMEPVLPPTAKRSSSALTAYRLGIVEEDDGTYSVYNGTTRVNEGGGRELALIVLDGQVRSFVAVHAPELIFVHAGVVAHQDRALVMPGDSFAGKTTLVAALVGKGATYYSDEFAVFDAKGLVHPYAKRLSMRPDPMGGQVETPVESFGGAAGNGAISLGLVTVTYYVPGAEWRPRTLTRGEAVLALLSKAVPARNRPEETLRVLSRAVDGVTVLEGERGEADEFADMLLELAPA
jgi:hypothetical protein